MVCFVIGVCVSVWNERGLERKEEMGAEMREKAYGTGGAWLA